ncbi:cell wall glucanase [Colletotrichum sojae]|uniref:Cell wall glucanase n=1 Tax=Colletotrichum sojae TaxID=2175907 RepID=A0A8H6MXB9_9PEZI|nr:cell wall glucanase [Colletotrichum sojae]
MKAIRLSSAALLALQGLSAAHPQGTRDATRAVDKPQAVVAETALKDVTKAPLVVVYVDEEGAPLKTITETVRLVPASRALSRSPEAFDLETRSKETSSRTNLPSSYSDYNFDASSVSSRPPASQSSSSSSPSASASGGLNGIAYAPYTAKSDCKTVEEVDADFSILKGGYSVVRIYGTDCDQVAKVLPAARKAGLKLFLGLFEIGPIEQQVQTIVSAVHGDWSFVDTISVGNELVNNGKATAQQVITAMSLARQLLRAAGYQGPVVTVDTFMAVLANPSLCDQSDYCAMNIHPFFDGNVAAGDAGPFVSRMVSQVRTKLANRNKRIVCTETGWPWQGDKNGVAVPGIDEQERAVRSIKTEYASHPRDVILFSAFNDMWKHAEANTFHAEQFWGIGGLYSDSDK